jgi:hypothetical protein
MGKIFGISNLPVSHFMSPFEANSIKTVYNDVPRNVANKTQAMHNAMPVDSVNLSTKVPSTSSNPVIKMRNGIGKLMNSIHSKK